MSERLLKASYLEAESKKQYTIADTLIWPACKVIANEMLSPDPVKETAKVLLSDMREGLSTDEVMSPLLNELKTC